MFAKILLVALGYLAFCQETEQMWAGRRECTTVEPHNRSKGRFPDDISVPGKKLRFLAVGDWGAKVGSHRTADQKDVASAMATACAYKSKNGRKGNCDFILSLGDNFYPHGVSSINSTRFQETWKDVYNAPTIRNLNWYITAGNHDYFEDVCSQVEYSRREPRWKYPALSYARRFITEKITVTLVSIDTQVIGKQKETFNKDWKEWKHGISKMLNFTREELKRDADWRIVFGHHPMFSGGRRSGDYMVRAKLLPILEKYNVDLYITGHDHNMQHWVNNTQAARNKSDKKGSLHHVILGTGGGSKLYKKNEKNVEENEELGMRMAKYEKKLGFGYFSVGRKRLCFRFIGVEGKELHKYCIEK